MKALFIGNTPESDSTVIQMAENNFPKVQLIYLNNTQNLTEMLAADGPFSFILLSLDDRRLVVRDIYKLIVEILGVRPFIFIGTRHSVKFQLNEDIFHNLQTNILVELPLSLFDFKKAMNTAIEWVKKEEFEESILEFSKDDLQPMRLRNFYLFDHIPYDVYLELTPTKFGKIISKDKFYPQQIIQSYSKKNVKYLYLKKDEHLKFLQGSVRNLLKIYEAKLIDLKRQPLLHLKTAFFFHQFIKAAGVSDEVNKLAHYFIDSVSETVRSTPNFTKLLISITQSQNLTFAEQSVLTAYVCEQILSNMGWGAEMTRSKLALAALLQDIALDNDDLIKIRSLADPNLKMFNESAQEDFKTHPQKAAHLANFFHGFSDVDFILLEQHEHPAGEGFPKGLNSSTLTPISCIFILADTFVSLFAQGPKVGHAPREIVAGMKAVYKRGNFKDPFIALEKTFKK